MPTLSVYCSEAELADWKQMAATQGLSASAWIRARLGEDPQEDRLEDHERRLARLEEMAQAL